MIINKHNINQYINGTSLFCYGKGITSIEDIPDYITIIACYDNQLTSLTKLPDSLRELWCSNNKLTSLPKLPDSLVYLYCDNNNITQLPMLPSSLTYLSCTNNQLSIYSVGDPHSGYPIDAYDKQWFINHNNQLKLDNRSTIINLINEIR